MAHICSTQHAGENAMTTLHRLDPDIFAAARKALDDDPRMPQDVRVHVDRGTVTLTGTVRTAHERSEAEFTVRQIAGVQSVVNRFNVAQVAEPDGVEAPDSR
jgi:osmotically-inducible protein OsmY